MQELKFEQVKEVNGGAAPAIAIGIGVVGGAIAGAQDGGGLRGAATGAALGGLAAVSGTMAATYYAAGKVVQAGAWALRAVGLTGASGAS